jgi:hypothetical protein
MLEQRKTGAGSPMGVQDFQRTAKALGRLIDDPEALIQARAEILATFEAEVAGAALRLHQEGYSYADLARAEGITRQSAHERWTKSWKKWGLK